MQSIPEEFIQKEFKKLARETGKTPSEWSSMEGDYL